MTGGLLEKAKSQEIELSPDSDDEVEAAVQQIDDGAGGLLAKVSASEDSAHPTQMDKILAGLSVALMLFSMYGLFNLSSLFSSTPVIGDNAGWLILVTTIAALATGSYALRNLVNGGTPLSKAQWMALVGAWLVLSLGPYLAAMNFAGSVAITGMTHDEDSNSISFDYRYSSSLLSSSGPFETVDVRVTQGGEEVWSGTAVAEESSPGLGSFTLSISDFYSENAFQVTGKKVTLETNDGSSYSATTTEVPYRVHAALSGLSEGMAVLDSRSLTRTIDDADGAMTGVIDDCDNCKDLLGVVLDVWAGSGLLDVDSDTRPAPAQGDYTILGEVFGPDGNIAFTYPLVTVDGTVASWDNSAGHGSGNGVIGDYGSQLNLPGTTTDGDPLGREYIERDDVLSDYGCYEFKVTVTMLEDWASGLAPTVSTDEFTFQREMNNNESGEQGIETLTLGCN